MLNEMVCMEALYSEKEEEIAGGKKNSREGKDPETGGNIFS